MPGVDTEYWTVNPAPTGSVLFVPIPIVPPTPTLNVLESCELKYSFVSSLS